MNAQQKMVTARTGLILDQRFFGSLALRLNLVADTTCETGWTDGRTLAYNPTWVDGLTLDKAKGFIAHEVMHNACSHTTRRNGRDKAEWNIDTDLAINGILLSAKFGLPDGYLYEAQYEGLAAEDIAAKRAAKGNPRPQPQTKTNGQPQPKGQTGQGNGQGPKAAPSSPQGQQGPKGMAQQASQGQTGPTAPQQGPSGQSSAKGSQGQPNNQGPSGPQQAPQGPTGSPTSSQGQTGQIDPQQAQNQGQPSDYGQCGEVRDATAPDGQQATQTDAAQQAQSWKVAVAQAAQQAQSYGYLPSALKRLIEEITNPTLDPWDILAQWVSRTAHNDYSWAKPNKRYLHTGLYLPSCISEEIPELFIAVDVSGSVDDDELNAMADRVTAILETYHAKATILFSDAAIQKIIEVTSYDLPLDLKGVGGGGGTDFRPVFKWVDDSGLLPTALIYLTDMDGRFPTTAPIYPVLWANVGHKGHAAPFGEILDLRP